MSVGLKPYVEGFRRALRAVTTAAESDSPWWPRSQPEATALSWAIGIELSSAETRWFYSCWGSRPYLKARVLDAYSVRHRPPGEPGLPEQRGRGRLFYPRQYLVDFSTYGTKGNAIDVALESEVYADHRVGSSSIDPNHDYNWDFAKLLYLPARTRVFVARVRAEERRERLWHDLAGIVADRDSFLREAPIIVYVLPSEQKGHLVVGCWTGKTWAQAALGTWRDRA